MPLTSASHPCLVVLVLLDAGARRRRDLDEGEFADPFRMCLEQPFDRPEPLLDSLGIVEPVDAGADRMCLAAGGSCRLTSCRHCCHRLRHDTRRWWPFDRDRVPLHRGRCAPVGDGERFPVDSRLEGPIHRVDEIVAVELGVESEDAAAEQAVEQLLAPRADRECLRIRPGDMPEGDDRGVAAAPCGSSWAAARSDSPGPARSGRTVLASSTTVSAKICIDLAILLPVSGPEDRAHVGDVAERPEPLVCRSRSSSPLPPLA